MADFINIKRLTNAELAGVVNLYPWYGGARKELCVRMVRSGGDVWGAGSLGDAAFYVGARGVIASLVRDSSRVDCSDKDLREIMESYMARDEQQKAKVRVTGGDFFTQDEYEGVRKESDNIFSRFAREAREEKSPEKYEIEDEFCTETLARIYAEQGYYEQAKHIYSKLLLNFPEKSAYFASLIKNLEEEIKI